jgi:hypothetical protein
MSRRRQKRNNRKKSITSSESLDDDEILEHEENDIILEEMNKKDQLKEGFEIPELDQQGISSSSEEESELEDDNQFPKEERGETQHEFQTSQDAELLDTMLIKNLELVNAFDIPSNNIESFERLRNFQDAYKAAVLYYFYLKSANEEEVTEHPVIKQITKLNNMISIFVKGATR